VEPNIIAPGGEISSGTVIDDFDYILPVKDGTCHSNIRNSIRLGLYDAVPYRAKLSIIANGPSALEADLKSLSPTLALNGSIRLFSDQGLAPTYWAGCDPQALLADYLPDDPPRDTVYFVASKCHPSVFEKLKSRDVRLWHIADHKISRRQHLPLACSVTLCASWLMHRLGYSDFEYWGWDGCFSGDRSHAGPGGDLKPGQLYINHGGKKEDGVIVGGKTFATTRTWAAEAYAAEQFFQLAKYFDIGVVVHGDGMIAAARAATFGESE
jgi:hypothetical protein